MLSSSTQLSVRAVLSGGGDTEFAYLALIIQSMSRCPGVPVRRVNMNSGGRLGEAIKSYKSLWQTTFRTKSVIRAWLKVLLLIKLFYVKFNLFEEDCLFRVTCFGFFVVCLSNVSTWRISRLQDYKIFQQSLESWDKLKPAAVICYSFCHQALVLKSVDASQGEKKFNLFLFEWFSMLSRR